MRDISVPNEGGSKSSHLRLSFSLIH